MGSSDDQIAVLRSVPMFAGIGESTLAEVAERTKLVELPAGEWLFRQGAAGTSLFVLRSGRLEVVKEARGGEHVLRTLAPGAVLGELAVLTGDPRSASVRARRDSTLLEGSSESFHDLLRGDPDFAVAVAQALAGQLQVSRAMSLPDDPLPRVVAVVAGTAGASSAGLAGELERELAARDRVARLTQELLPEGATPGAELDRLERSNQWVLLAAEEGDGDWARFCLRQADRVLVVAAGGHLQSPPDRLRGCDLVVEPEAQAELGGLLEALDPRVVFPPLPAGGSQAAIIARRLAGRSVGLVLSGGGARGLAHIGVLDQLLEMDARVDRIGGCSMGALVGGLFATGLGPDEIETQLRRELVEGNPMSDYTLPLAALVRGRKAEAMLLRLFGDTRIEELAREFFCVSSDLVTSELFVHRRGPLYEAVGASICLPGIGPPVGVDGRLLVDGGVLNNLPVEIMGADREGPVLASDVTAPFQPPARKAGGAARPRMRRLSAGLRRAIIGWDHPLPSFAETLTRTIVLGSINTAEAARRHATAVITPDVQGIGLVEFDRIAELREEGRVAAREALGGAIDPVLEESLTRR